MVTDEEYAVALDAAYPLAEERSLLLRADPDLIYLDGNSLGPLPTSTRDRLAAFVSDEWGGDLVRGWQTWVDLPAQRR